MKTIQSMLLTAAALGLVICGLLGILVVLDVASLREARETLIKATAVISIITATAIAVILVMRAASKSK